MLPANKTNTDTYTRGVEKHTAANIKKWREEKGKQKYSTDFFSQMFPYHHSTHDP